MQPVFQRRLFAASAFFAGLCIGLTAATGATAQQAHGAARNGLMAFMRPGTLGEYDIWAVLPDGSGLRRLTRSPEGRSDYNPVWSPNGSTVLFERRKLDENASGGDEALYGVSARGGRVRQITHCRGECWGDGESSWSADGSKIAFGRATGPRSAPGPALVAVYVSNAGGSGVTQLSKPPRGWEDHYPNWSPDGKTIVFERDRSTNPAGASKIMAVDVGSGAERLVYALPSWAPSGGIPKYSPDGTRILFSYWCVFGDQCPPASHSDRNARLATIQPDGAGLHVLPLKILADSPGWSPDGQQIVFRCHRAAGSFHLCTSKLDGTGLKQFPWPLESSHPSWGTHS